MIGIELKPSGRDTSKIQSEINALAHLGDIESHGHKTHELMATIDTTMGDSLTLAVERATNITSLGTETRDMIDARALRMSAQRKNARLRFRLSRHR